MRRVGELAAVIALSICAVALLVMPAGAADSTRIVDDGWWWRLQTGVGGQPLPPPPNVDDEQLMVQAQPEGATAIAAISAELPDGHTNPVLTLTVSDDQGGATAVLLACQAGSAWTGVHAGNWEAKPSADCETASTEGVRSEDGSSWTFDLGSLQFNDKVSVVLVPGTNDAGAVSPFSLVFDPPQATSIATSDGASPAPPSTSTSTTVAIDTGATTADDSSTPPPDDGLAAPPGGSIDLEPELPPEPALDEEDQGQTLTAPVVNEATRPDLGPVLDDEPSRTAARAGGVLVLLMALAGAAALLRNNGVASFASATASASEGNPIEGGLGRFRRDRTAEPTPVT